MKSCDVKCVTCADWKPSECIVCYDAINRLDAPACECKTGYYDTYDFKQNSECIPTPKYYIPQPPEWNWITGLDNDD